MSHYLALSPMGNVLSNEEEGEKTARLPEEEPGSADAAACVVPGLNMDEFVQQTGNENQDNNDIVLTTPSSYCLAVTPEVKSSVFLIDHGFPYYEPLKGHDKLSEYRSPMRFNPRVTVFDVDRTQTRPLPKRPERATVDPMRKFYVVETLHRIGGFVEDTQKRGQRRYVAPGTPCPLERPHVRDPDEITLDHLP